MASVDGAARPAVGNVAADGAAEGGGVGAASSDEVTGRPSVDVAAWAATPGDAKDKAIGGRRNGVTATDEGAGAAAGVADEAMRRSWRTLPPWTWPRGRPWKVSLRTRPPAGRGSGGCRCGRGHRTTVEDVVSVDVAARTAVGGGPAADEATGQPRRTSPPWAKPGRLPWVMWP